MPHAHTLQDRERRDGTFDVTVCSDQHCGRGLSGPNFNLTIVKTAN